MAGKSQFRLLGQRRFAPFFVTQFLGALNDNVFRNGLLILVTFQGIAVAGMNDSQLANVAGALFILPYFLFSATAGQLADKYEKSMLMRRIKLLEVALMSLASAAFLTGEFELLLAVLFLMGLQSTLFGPVKYAYLPQRLADNELVGGNALVVAGNYIAIIKPEGGRKPLFIGQVPVEKNTAVFVYAVGTPSNHTFQVIVDTQSIE